MTRFQAAPMHARPMHTIPMTSEVSYRYRDCQYDGMRFHDIEYVQRPPNHLQDFLSAIVEHIRSAIMVRN